MSLELGTQAGAVSHAGDVARGEATAWSLDNGEHLVGAVAELVDVLRANVPGLRIW